MNNDLRTSSITNKSIQSDATLAKSQEVKTKGHTFSSQATTSNVKEENLKVGQASIQILKKEDATKVSEDFDLSDKKVSNSTTQISVVSKVNSTLASTSENYTNPLPMKEKTPEQIPQEEESINKRAPEKTADEEFSFEAEEEALQGLEEIRTGSEKESLDTEKEQQGTIDEKKEKQIITTTEEQSAITETQSAITEAQSAITEEQFTITEKRFQEILPAPYRENFEKYGKIVNNILKGEETFVINDYQKVEKVSNYVIQNKAINQFNTNGEVEHSEDDIEDTIYQILQLLHDLRLITSQSGAPLTKQELNDIKKKFKEKLIIELRNQGILPPKPQEIEKEKKKEESRTTLEPPQPKTLESSKPSKKQREEGVDLKDIRSHEELMESITKESVQKAAEDKKRREKFEAAMEEKDRIIKEDIERTDQKREQIKEANLKKNKKKI
jgi:hypothetical protein